VDTFLEIVSSIKVLGPLGIVVFIEAYAIYALFNKLEDLQDKRLDDWKTMNQSYQDLSNEINRTLDTVLKVIGRKNGNGNDNGGCKNG
jgi:hypothetical protein